MAKKSQEATVASFTQASEITKGLPVYEAGFHIVPTVAESDVAIVFDRVRSALEKAGGAIISEESPKKITFSYRIERSIAGKREKYTEGYFGSIKFEAEEGIVAKSLEEALHADREILRSIVIHTTREQIEAPRAVFGSDALVGETIQKPVAAPEEPRGEVSDEDIEKTIESLVV